MPKRTSKSGSELFIVDNSDEEWKVMRYLHDWCQLSKAIDVATGYFEIGSLLALKDEWQKVDSIRILMGDEVSKRTRAAFIEGRPSPFCRNGTSSIGMTPKTSPPTPLECPMKTVGRTSRPTPNTTIAVAAE